MPLASRRTSGFAVADSRKWATRIPSMPSLSSWKTTGAMALRVTVMSIERAGLPSMVSLEKT